MKVKITIWVFVIEFRLTYEPMYPTRLDRIKKTKD